MKRSFFMKIFLFFLIFTATAAVIRIDTSAGALVGNDPFFSSYFTRVSEREVDIKILGFETSLVNGLAVADTDRKK